MTLPAPPYTYDDPRIGYDEHCFFYDGGYDSICLAQPDAVIIKRSGGDTGASRRRREREKEKHPFLNLFIQANLKEVNGDAVPFDSNKGWVRFSGENTPLAVFVQGVKVGMNAPYAEGYLRNLATKSTAESVNASVKLVDKTDKAPEVIAEFQEPANPDIRIETLEPYENIKVTCELIPANTGSLVVSSELIKKTDE